MAQIQKISQIKEGSLSIIYETTFKGDDRPKYCTKFIPHISQQMNLFSNNHSTTQNYNEDYLLQNNAGDEICLSETYLGYDDLYKDSEDHQTAENSMQYWEQLSCNRACKNIENEIKIGEIVKDSSYISIPLYHVKNESNFLENRIGCLLISELAETQVQGKKIHDLFDVAQYFPKQVSDLETLRCIFTQILRGLEHLHQNSITHGDIRLENILVFKFDQRAKEFKIKLTDFGYSSFQLRDYQEQLKAYSNLDSTYFSPEMNAIKSGQQQDRIPDESKCDIFAVGIMMFDLFSSFVLSQKQIKRKPQMKSLYHTFITKDHKNFIEQLNSTQRKRLQESKKKYQRFSFQKEQLKDFYHVLYGMLAENPFERLSATQALESPFFQECNQK